MKTFSKSHAGASRQCAPLASKSASDPLHHVGSPPADGSNSRPTAPTLAERSETKPWAEVFPARQKHPRFGSFLPVEKYPQRHVSATQSVTNKTSPTKIQPKPRKVAKNDPIAIVSRIDPQPHMSHSSYMSYQTSPLPILCATRARCCGVQALPLCSVTRSMMPLAGFSIAFLPQIRC